MPGAVGELGAPQELESAPYRRMLGRDLCAFHQGEERLAGAVGVTLQGSQLRPATVGALLPDQCLRERLQRAGLIACPRESEQLMDAFFIGLGAGFHQPLAGTLHARFQFTLTSRDGE